MKRNITHKVLRNTYRRTISNRNRSVFTFCLRIHSLNLTPIGSYQGYWRQSYYYEYTN